ncbi:MAG TPA: PKD domain-containing protein [Longimicrobiales bacterium]|nr:PKD domain-containing protein [Longimicrobiales bacterium]
MTNNRRRCVCTLIAIASYGVPQAEAKTIYVAAGGNLQEALDASTSGDTILLEEGGEFVGNFVLPVKSGDQPITLRTSAPDTVLPGPGQRIRPSQAPLLARVRSPNALAALRTAPGSSNWHIRYLEFAGNQDGYGDILQIGDGSSSQNTLDKVPRAIVLSHLYVHGDPHVGQKRCIALNAAHVTIADSHVADCKGVGQDTQAIAGWNGPGPYVIENNYLEGAGENVMFGGADPAIPNLVADGITFRRNYLSRPMSWRNPILETPRGLTAASEPAGSLPAGVYAYRVVAWGPVGSGNTGRSTASPEVSGTSAGGDAIRLRWQAVAGASEYRVYGRTAGSQSMYWRVTTTELVDTGAAGTAEVVPTSPGTVWTVKNVFELKNARNVVIEDNIFENHWKQAQPGYAIVLTPRNSGGNCSWCVVENVRFDYNIVRNTAAGVNLLGYDVPSRPTRQTRNIAFRHNLFAGLTSALGGNAWFMLIGDEPRDIIIEHNTIDASGASVVYTYGGTSTSPRQIHGFQMTANAARHGSYGFNGAFFSYGNGILDNFYPGAVFEANYLAGGSASRYPAGNVFSGVFADQFVDAAGGDFTLRSDSILAGSGPGGSDIGVDYPGLAARLAGVEAGTTGELSPNVPPVASFASSCLDLTCTFTCTSTDADGTIAARAWAFADGAVGAGATFTRTFAAPGEYAVSLTVADDDGAEAEASAHVPVTALLHIGNLDGLATSWVKYGKQYWSASVLIAVHGADERIVPDARVDFAWSGAVVKTGSCVTKSTGVCTVDSGTLNWKRGKVKLTVTGVSAPGSAYSAANHDDDGSSNGTEVIVRKPH